MCLCCSPPPSPPSKPASVVPSAAPVPAAGPGGGSGTKIKGAAAAALSGLTSAGAYQLSAAGEPLLPHNLSTAGNLPRSDTVGAIVSVALPFPQSGVKPAGDAPGAAASVALPFPPPGAAKPASAVSLEAERKQNAEVTQPAIFNCFIETMHIHPQEIQDVFVPVKFQLPPNVYPTILGDQEARAKIFGDSPKSLEHLRRRKMETLLDVITYANMAHGISGIIPGLIPHQAIIFNIDVPKVSFVPNVHLLEGEGCVIIAFDEDGNVGFQCREGKAARCVPMPQYSWKQVQNNGPAPFSPIASPWTLSHDQPLYVFIEKWKTVSTISTATAPSGVPMKIFTECAFLNFVPLN